MNTKERVKEGPKIVKSDLDKREYKLITLQNEMQCLIISDSEADKSAGAINVHAGAGLDEKSHYGTAHFLEHMLFQGTEKYPVENDFDEYITNNGGYNNAFTSMEDTNYQFECSNDALEGALDRLSQFFISPKFSVDSTEREVNAVDSEFNQQLTSDWRHYFKLTQWVSNPNGNYNRFTTGNKSTLQVEGMRDVLLQFHQKWYSSNIMTLCVIGKQDIQTLQKWVTDKFSPVVNKNVVIPDLCLADKPFRKEDIGKLIKYIPVQDKDVLTFFYVLEYCEKDYKTQPLDFLSSVIGHEGKNSLLSYLIAQDLAIELSTSPGHSLGGMTSFEIDITLTKKGISNYENVIEATFSYLQQLRRLGPSEQFFYDEKKVGQMNFFFADKTENIDEAVKFSQSMAQMGDNVINQMIRSSYITDVFAPAQIQQYLIDMCRVDTFNIFIRSKQFAGETDRVSKWYKMNHSVQDFSSDLITKMKNPRIEDHSGTNFGYPGQNDLIATDFNLIERQKGDSVQQEPYLLKRWEGCTDLWYKKDSKFERPKVSAQLKIYTNDCDWISAPQGQVFTEIWSLVVDECLRESNYAASLANLDFSMSLTCDYVNLEWSGFNHCMPLFIHQTIEQILMLKTKNVQQIFNQIKEKLLQDWNNFYLEQTSKQASKILSTLLVDVNLEKKCLRDHLQLFTYEMYQMFSGKWLNNGRSIWYITGNVSEQQSMDIVQSSRLKLNLNQIQAKSLDNVRAVKMEQQTCYQLEIPLQDKSNENSCNMTIFEVGHIGFDDHKSAVLNELVMQYLDEPFYDDLRTKQQLGYVVYSRQRIIRGVAYNVFCVQSPQHSPEYLAHCTSAFLELKRENVSSLRDEDFEKVKSSLHTIIAEKDINLSYEAYRYWGEISSHQYVFKRQELQLEALSQIQIKDFQNHFVSVFFSDNSKRLELQLVSQLHQDEQNEYRLINQKSDAFSKQFLERVRVGHNIPMFKQMCGLYPDFSKSNFLKTDQELVAKESQ